MRPHPAPSRSIRIAGVALALLLAASAASAQDAPAPQEPLLPQARQSGAVVYVTGGVAKGESQAFEAARADYPLSIELLQADPGGQDQFTAGAEVRVLNAAGVTVLEATADGPFMLVQLPPGRYQVLATLNGRHAPSRNVTVQDEGSGRAVLRFPAGTD